VYKQAKISFGKKVLGTSEKYSCAIVYDKKPVKATEMDTLRRNIRMINGKVQVGGNLIVSKALSETSFSSLSEKLKGSNIIVFFNSPFDCGKIQNQIKSLKDKFTFKCAVINGTQYSEAEFNSIARFDSRNTGIAYMLSSMNSPISSLARLLKQHYEIMKEGQK
jgi:large subunit ribosomal protein L10